jgi:hypothetical protein
MQEDILHFSMAESLQDSVLFVCGCNEERPPHRSGIGGCILYVMSGYGAIVQGEPWVTSPRVTEGVKAALRIALVLASQKFGSVT